MPVHIRDEFVAWNYYSARGDMPDDSFSIRDEFVDCLCHRVCAVKGPNQSVLGKRVSLFFDIPLHNGCLTVANRPR